MRNGNFSPRFFFPKLRPYLDSEAVEYEGARYLIIFDRSGIAERQVVVPDRIVPFIAHCNGEHSLEDLCEAAAVHSIDPEELAYLIYLLEESLLLDSPAFMERQEEIRAEFSQSSIREAALAGAVYPADRDALLKLISEQKLFAKRDQYHATQQPLKKRLIAVASPHIDYRRGGKTYGTTSLLLEEYEAPEVIFLMGTAHQPAKGIFHLSKKNFETPLGTVQNEVGITSFIGERFGVARSFAEEILHRKEHSLELQLPLLQCAYAAPPLIVPILVGSFQHFLDSPDFLDQNSEVSEFAAILTEAMQLLTKEGRKWLCHCGVDLAHVGRSFGDSETASDGSALSVVRERDSQLLDAVNTSDPAALFRHILEDRDKRRICGFPSLFTSLIAINNFLADEAPTGVTERYEQAVDSETDCVVSFAAVSLTTYRHGLHRIR